MLHFHWMHAYNQILTYFKFYTNMTADTHNISDDVMLCLTAPEC